MKVLYTQCSYLTFTGELWGISMALHKNVVTPLLLHWSYHSLVPSHRLLSILEKIDCYNRPHSIFQLCCGEDPDILSRPENGGICASARDRTEQRPGRRHSLPCVTAARPRERRWVSVSSSGNGSRECRHNWRPRTAHGYPLNRK